VAPNHKGQIRAMEMAYADAGIDPKSVAYVEAHGTATPIGDVTEVAALRRVFGGAAPNSIALGSAKANVGHSKAAAGAVGLLRAALALSEGVIPPHASFERPNPRLKLDDSPFRIPRSPEDWPGGSRFAGVSSYGFGGINYHVVIGGEGGGTERPVRAAVPEVVRPREAALSMDVVAFGAVSRGELLARAREIRGLADDPGLVDELRAAPPVRSFPWRMAFPVDGNGRADRLDAAIAWLERGEGAARLEALGVAIREGEPFDPGAVAFMFPGQGSQYINMLAELRQRYAVVDETLREADAVLAPVLGSTLSRYLYPGEEARADQAFAALTDTSILQPAIIACNEAVRRLLDPLLRPSVVFGHSLGEYSACVAAGVIDFASALRVTAVRGTATATLSADDPGLMLGVAADETSIAPILSEIPGYVTAVNKNCPSQTVLGGASVPVRAAEAALRARGFQCAFLPVTHAFHSEIVAPVCGPLREELSRFEIRSPRVPVLSNVTGDFYVEGNEAPAWIRATLSRQVASPVEFIRVVRRAYERGARVFVEVGPKRALSSFVSDILKGEPHRTVFVSHPKFGELSSLHRALAALVADGVVPYGAAEAAGAPDARPLPRRPPHANAGAELAAPTAIRPAPRLEVPAPAANSGDPKGLEKSDLEDILLAEVAALTGYSRSELDLDAKIEAELGIDSIRQLEILAAIQRKLGLPGGDSFDPSKYPTLRSLLDFVRSQPPAPGAPAVAKSGAGTARAPVPRGGESGDVAARLVSLFAVKTGYTIEELGLDADIETELGIDSIRQLEILAAAEQEFHLQRRDDVRIGEHRTIRALAGRLERWLREDRPGAHPDAVHDAARWEAPFFSRRLTLEPAGAPPASPLASPSVSLCGPSGRGLAEQLASRVAVLAADATEGAVAEALSSLRAQDLVDLYGLEAAVGEGAFDAAREATQRVARIGRVLRRGGGEIQRVIVVRRDGASPAARAAQGAAIGAWRCLMRELVPSAAGRVKVVTVADGLPDAVVLDGIRSASATPDGHDAAFDGEGWRFAVLRPFAAPSEPASPKGEGAILLVGGARGITARVAAELARRGFRRLVLFGRSDAEGHEPGEGKTGREQQEAAENVRALRALGADVLYVRGDAGDAADARRAFRDASGRFGSVDILVLAAGVDRSRDVLRKSESEIDQVLRPKVGAAEEWLRAAREDGARVVVFSSVAALFGSPGQVDYGAANQALTELAVSGGGTALAFGPWAEVGLAAPLASIMRERSVDMLPPAAAARVTADAIMTWSPGTYAICGRLPLPLERGPLLRETALFVPGAELTRTVVLRAGDVRWLTDHSRGQIAILPAAVAIEMMLEVCESLFPGARAAPLQDVRFRSMVTLRPGHEVELTANARVEHESRGAVLRASVVCNGRICHELTAIPRAALQPPPSAERTALPPEGRRVDGTTIYEWFFHGPSFQVLSHAGLCDGAAVGYSRALAPPLGADLPADAGRAAMLHEIAFQTAAVFAREVRHELAIPSGINRAERHAPVGGGDRVTAVARFIGEDGGSPHFDVTLASEDGRLLEELGGLSLHAVRGTT
jgi:acyl transferase domain-containing protein/NADP-dependent 3-hydroxy acid dehydrogenase YdfG